MALNDDEQRELLELLDQTRQAARKAADGWQEALDKASQLREATKSAAQTAQLAIERLQKQEALVNAVLKWREENPKVHMGMKVYVLELLPLAEAADNYNKYLKERS